MAKAALILTVALVLLGAGFATDELPEAVVNSAFGDDLEVQQVVSQQGTLRGSQPSEPSAPAEAERHLEEENSFAVGEAEYEGLLEELASVDAGNSCQSGLVGQAYKYAPACFNKCSYACGAINEAINAYMRKGGQSAAKKVVCRRKSQFSCFVKRSNIGNCRPLISKAASFGFSLPSSVGDLNRQCR
jgi:hypothetical protein